MHIFGVYGKTIKKTGITWHMVKESIDTGDILVQKEIKLDNNCTALSLLNAQHKLALTLFREALEILKNKAFKMQISGGGVSQKIIFTK
ncbi:formyltransferase family protein [Campylobacter jejuni]|nr:MULTISPECIES: formyltransferase family protein [Campylobacter]WLQ73748.1 formyltransferase family protein [Campylobacter jejuni]MDK2044260.1 formyltransferase family protein [Campylobacter coli]WLQ89716.1 formyltransferase family protein [Campylobacter jejuni]WLR01820.1 formyltransferase family protein [Campylobacter jejuni]WLR22201.1 formyltransferase family protein [Campylobacter jejuni]